MNQPLISIVTISYNQGHFIRETIDSVLSQLPEDCEYIIIDGNSDDNSVSIINEYTDKLAFFVSEPDKGAADALNKGLAAAKGKYFYYLNSDDLLLSGAIDRMKLAITKYPSADVIYGHGLIQFDHDKSRHMIYSDKWDLNLYQSSVISIVQQGTIFRMDTVKNAGGFNQKNRLNWDGELLVDVALGGAKFEREDIVLGVFRMYPGSITSSLGGKRAQQAKENRRRISKKIEESANVTPKNRKLALFLKMINDPAITLRRSRHKFGIDNRMEQMKKEPS